MKLNHRVLALLAGAAVLTAGAVWTAGAEEHQHPMPGAAAISAHPDSGQGSQKHAGHEGMGHSHEKCELHGGQVTMTAAHHFETVFTPEGLRVYLYSDQQWPTLADGVTGKITLKYKDGTSKEVPLTLETIKPGEKAVYVCPMHPDQVKQEYGTCPVCKMKLAPQAALFGKVDLTHAVPEAMKAVIEVKGMEGPEAAAQLTETFHGFEKAEGAAGHGEHKSHY